MRIACTRSCIVLALAAMAAGLIGPACRTDHPARRTVRFWAMGAEGENVQKLLPEFERQHPEIDVELQGIPWTAAHEKLLTAFAGNALPDLWQLGNTWIPEFELLGALEDLGSWEQRSQSIDSGSYFAGIWETNLVRDRLWGIPWYVDTRVLFYRSDIFRAAGATGPPQTWHEWLELSRRIKRLAGDREAYAMLLPTNEFTPPLILGLQTGATFLRDQDTRGDFSCPEFTRAFTFYTEFFREGLAPVGVTRVTNIYQGLAEGVFAMYITGPWNLGEFERRLPDSLQDDWATAPLPAPDGNYPGASIAGGASLVMSRTSQCKDAVWALIEYLSAPEQQVAFYHATGNLPARKEAWSESSFRRNPRIQAFYEQLGNVRATPKVPEWERIMMRLQDFAELTSRQERPVTDLLRELDSVTDRILEKRRWLIYER
jgi:multiple sugar transport system substrate-binding protein